VSEPEPCRHCGGTGIETIPLLRRIRLHAGLTQGQVAAKLGIDASSYSRIEATGKFAWKHGATLWEVFGVTLNQLHGVEPLPWEKPERPKRPADKARVARSKRRRATVRKRNRA
jgi:DNA-binding XRE family transcriptional regulator